MRNYSNASRVALSTQEVLVVEDDLESPDVVLAGRQKQGFRLKNGFVQVVLTGVIAFCGCGMFNALQGLGGAGSSDPAVSAFANFLLYACFCFFGYFAGAFFNTFGAKVLITAGALAYALYGLMSYLVGLPEFSSWASAVFIAAGGLTGIGAAFFWSAQGALMMAYAPAHKKAQYISTFWVLFNLGGFIGGMIAFATTFGNSGSTATHANPATYFAYIGIMCVGVLISATLLVTPSKVVRADGFPVVVPKQLPFRQEVLAVANVILDGSMIRLTVLFFFSNFFYTYVFNGVNAQLFTIRTRGLNSALYFGSQMFGTKLFALVADYDTGNRSLVSRARGAFTVTFSFCVVAWGLGVYLRYGYNGGYLHGSGKTLIDFASIEWVFPVINFILYGISDSMVQTYCYWLMSLLGKNDPALCCKYCGYFKSIQSLGAAIAWLLDSEYLRVAYVTQMWICICLLLVGLPLSVTVFQRLARLE